MKYAVYCHLSENSIKDITYFHHKNLKNISSLKLKQNFFIPIINFNIDDYLKIKNSILKEISKLSMFRVSISSVKNDSNKLLYMLIEPKGFLTTIQRIFEEELIRNKVKSYELFNKWNYFYIEYCYLNKNNIEINNNIQFPKFVKVNLVNIYTTYHKKSSIINSIKLKNV